MNITEANTYQDAFDAVMNGSANDAQAQEVIAVTRALRSYLQEAELRARALPERREDFLALLAKTKRGEIETAIGIDKAIQPRLIVYWNGEVGAPENEPARFVEPAPVSEPVAEPVAER